MNNEIDIDFKDIENSKESEQGKYLFVSILYIIVIILVVLLVLSIKNQKKVVSNSLNANKVINNEE